MENINRPRVLFVDDEPDVLRSLSRIARKLDAEILTANGGHEALEIIEQSPVDVLVTDMRMPQMDGNELLAQVAKKAPETVRIVLTGYADMDMVLGAINSGHIWGYLQKPWDNMELIVKLKQALQLQQVLAERTLMRRTIEQYQYYRKEHFEGFIGDSVAMQFVYSSIEQCAPSQASVFITGPSGSGKEVAAAAIHQLSKRSDKPFVALNCAAIPSELMESEVFGHVKGAFSGAVSNRDGAASLANGGTLFLDEIGEMDINLQAKLLRFIQDGKFQKVGSGREEYADIRFVCATNRDPQQAIKESKLREDLFYRLNVISLFMPPLNQRDRDSLKLAEHFLKHYSELEDKVFAGFASDAQQLILDYEWPGNVRQLQNVIHSCVVMSQGPMVSRKIVESQLGQAQQSVGRSNSIKATLNQPIHNQSITDNSSLDETANMSLAQIERQAITQTIKRYGGNVVKAANELEVSPSTLYRKIQQWQDENSEQISQ